MRKAVVALAIGAVVGAAWLFLRPGSVISLDVSTWRTYGGDVNGWSLRHPPSWRAQALAEDCSFLDYEGGVIVTNTSFAFRDPRGGVNCFGRFVLAGFPRDGVALAWKPLGHRWPLFPIPRPDTAFPIRFEDLVHTDAIRGGPAVSVLAVQANRQPVYQVRVWIGRDASDVDREAMARVLFSIRLLRVPPA